MQIEEIRFRLRPRSMFEVMDLALLAIRQQLMSYGLICVSLGVPLMIINWALVTLLEWDVVVSVLLLILEAPILSVPLVIYTADLVFEVDPQAVSALKRAWRAYPQLFLEFFIIRPILYVIPLGFLIYQFRYRFSIETGLLEQLKSRKKRERMRFLQAHDLHGTGLTVTLYFVAFVSALGAMYTYAWMLGTILGDFAFGQLDLPMPNLVLIHLVATMLISYWYVVFFFDYIDVRTTREGWDLSLELRMAGQS